MREITQSPYDDTCHEDDASHLLQVLLTLFPGMAAYRLPGREAVRRQLHYEWGIFALHHETGKDAAQYHGKEDADEIERYHDERTVLDGKERSDDHDVDWQTSRTAHQWQYQHRYQTGTVTLDGSCCHHGWYVTSESHNQRDE